jgi:hypothetical protein
MIERQVATAVDQASRLKGEKPVAIVLTPTLYALWRKSVGPDKLYAYRGLLVQCQEGSPVDIWIKTIG